MNNKTFWFFTIMMVVMIGGMIASCSNRDKSYNDYEITGARYYIVVEESGVFTTKRTEYHYVDIFFNNEKITKTTGNIEISDRTFVRKYNNGWDGIKVYMTQEDYERVVRNE